MKRVFNILLFLTLFSVVSMAQVTFPSKSCEAFRPKLFLSNAIVKESEILKFMKSRKYGQDETPNEKKFWFVYSDRSNNKLYDSSKSRVVGYLDFNERVIILKIEGDWAFVYDDPKNEQYPLISSAAVPKGWIKMENLLLWDRAPGNNQKIVNKALIAYNLNLYDKSSQRKSYSNPNTRTEIGDISFGMNYYFVFKKDEVNNMSLLATTSSVDGVTELLFGWVPNSEYVPWNERTCLEPNWNQDDVEAMKGTSVSMYRDEGMTKPLTRYSFGTRNVDIVKMSTMPEGSPERREYNKIQDMIFRMPSGSLRYPLLGAEGDKYKCTAFFKIEESLNKAIEYDAKWRAAKDSAEMSMKAVNLILVIDGTVSMKPYYEYVHKAIQECTYFSKDYDFKVGLVIYRDYLDGEKGLIEYLPLRDRNDGLLKKYLLEGGEYGIRSDVRDKSKTEALFKGLETALDNEKMGYKKNEHNIFAVIGDCGNALNDRKAWTESDIISKMVVNRVQLMVFQVDNQTNTSAYDLFNDQLTDIAVGNMNGQYAKMKDLGIKVRFKEVANGYDLKIKSDDRNLEDKQYKIASIRRPASDSRMEPKDLAKLLDDQFGAYLEIIKKQILIIDRVNVNTSNIDDKALAMDSGALLEVFDYDKERYLDLQRRNQLLAYDCYTDIKSPGKRDYWKPIVFLNQQEFNSLMKSFEGLYEASLNDRKSPGKLREEYVNAIKALLKSLLPGIDEKQMAETSVEDVMMMVNGLPVKTGSMEKHSIKDISMKTKVSDKELRGLVSNFKKKYDRLKSIKDNYFFSFEEGDVRYYWIPLEDMP